MPSSCPLPFAVAPSHPNPSIRKPPTKKTSPSKRVTLKLKVINQDLANGKYRPTPSPAAATISKPTTVTIPNARPRRKPAVARRPRRGRPRNSSIIAAAAEKAANDAQLHGEAGDNDADDDDDDDDDDDADRDEEQKRLDRWRREGPSLADFQSVSDLGFPMLVRSSTEMPQEQAEAQTRQTKPARQCASCGVVATPDAGMEDNDDKNNLTSITPDTANNVAHLQVRTRPHLLTPLPWSLLNLHPTGHQNPDTNSITDLIVTRTGPRPNTVGFWYDMTIAEQAKASQNLDFKMLCLGLMRGREEGDLEGEMSMWAVEEWKKERGGGQAWYGWMDSRLDIRGTVWDDILVEGVVKGKVWRKTRRWREGQRERAAGWAVWERRMRRGSRGGFVRDVCGAWVLRAPGMDGEVRRVLRLGYKREGRPKRVRGEHGWEDQSSGQVKPQAGIGGPQYVAQQVTRSKDCAVVDEGEGEGKDEVETGRIHNGNGDCGDDMEGDL